MRFSLRTLLIVMLLAVMLGTAAIFYREYKSFARSMEASYATERVVRKINDYVEAHAGAWPKSWDDIDATAIEREHVVSDFGLTPEEISQDPERIYSSVVPITRAGREPIDANQLGHFKFAFDQLRDSVLKYRPMPEEIPAE